MFHIFQYSFMVRAFIAGGAIALIAPVIGTFLVLRKFSYFADTLSHVALAGIAIGVITGLYPIITAVITCIVAAIVIEKLRSENKMYTEGVLALFLSGSLAIALVLISLAHGFNVNLFSYLFGSITAVEDFDIYVILGLTLVVLTLLIGFYKELSFISFDEEAAKVSGLPVKRLNLLLMISSAVTVSLSMRIVGVMMVGALMVIPVLSALQIAKSFKNTIIYSLVFSLISVFSGLIFAYYLDIVAGGAIVLVALALFLLIMLFTRLTKSHKF